MKKAKKLRPTQIAMDLRWERLLQRLNRERRLMPKGVLGDWVCEQLIHIEEVVIQGSMPRTTGM